MNPEPLADDPPRLLAALIYLSHPNRELRITGALFLSQRSDDWNKPKTLRTAFAEGKFRIVPIGLVYLYLHPMAKTC